MSEQKTFQEFLDTLYTKPLSDSDVLKLYEVFKYQGFHREDTIKQLFEQVKDPRIIQELIVLCAIQSPNKASQQKLTTNGLTPMQMGISASGQKGTKKLSCARICASTADLAAFYLKKIPSLPKKVMSSDLPAWLQFPSAAAIRMPMRLRKLHREFSETFSMRIDITGKYPFNPELYDLIQENSYLDERLGLFDSE